MAGLRRCVLIDHGHATAGCRRPVQAVWAGPASSFAEAALGDREGAVRLEESSTITASQPFAAAPVCRLGACCGLSHRL